MKKNPKFKGFRRKFWIRQDREQYLLSGVMIASTIASFVSAYWHFSDRISPAQSDVNIKINQSISRKDEFKRFRERGSYIPSQNVQKQYYHIEENLPKVPKFKVDQPENSDEQEK